MSLIKSGSFQEFSSIPFVLYPPISVYFCHYRNISSRFKKGKLAKSRMLMSSSSKVHPFQRLLPDQVSWNGKWNTFDDCTLPLYSYFSFPTTCFLLPHAWLFSQILGQDVLSSTVTLPAPIEGLSLGWLHSESSTWLRRRGIVYPSPLSTLPRNPPATLSIHKGKGVQRKGRSHDLEPEDLSLR